MSPATKRRSHVRRTRDTALVPDIIAYLKKNVGIHVTSSELVKATGRTPSQVNSAMSRIKRRLDGSLEEVQKGMFVYRPHSNKKGNPLWEEIARTRDGRYVMQSENGEVIIMREEKN